MDTEDFIETLSRDSRRHGPSLRLAWWGGAGLALIIAAAVFFTMLGPRPDIASAAETWRFLFKIFVSIVLACSAFGLVRTLSRPGDAWRHVLSFLAVAPLLLAAAIAIELSVVPQELWAGRLVGVNSMTCLTWIPLIGIGPLAVLLLALRHGAPARPAAAGAVAGLLAGGIAAAFYAAHCPDDSPLFVATWYTIAIAGLSGVGAVAAGRFARW